MALDAIKAGDAFVRLTLKDDTDDGLNNYAAKFRRVALGLGATGAAIGGVGAAISAPLQLSVNAASDAAEELNKFRAVFGDLADDADAYAVALASSVQRSSNEVRSSLSVFQSFFKGLGLDDTGAAELSKQMAALSIDFASFNNVSDDEAVTRMIAALSGSSEVLAKYGVNTKAAALETVVLSEGLAESYKDATEAQKALARLSVITDTLGKQGAIGDAAKTSDSYANSTKGLTAAFRELAEAVGKPLLASRAAFKTTIADTIRDVTEFVGANEQLVVIAATVGTALSVAGGVLIVAAGAALAATLTMGLFSRGAASTVGPLVGVSTATAGLTSRFLGLGKTILGPVVGAFRAAVVAVGQFVFAAGAAAVAAVHRLAVALVGPLGAAIAKSIASFTVFTGSVLINALAGGVAAAVSGVTALAAAMGITLPAAVATAAAAIVSFLSGGLAVPAVIAGIVGALFLWSTATAIAGQAAGQLAADFQKLFTVGKLAAEGIFLAFQNKDFGGLFRILGQSLYAGFLRGTSLVVNLLESVLGKKTVAIVYGLGAGIIKVGSYIAKAVAALLEPVFALVRSLVGLVGNLIGRVLEFFGLVSSTDVGGLLADSADEATAKLEQMVAAQREAKKISDAANAGPGADGDSGLFGTRTLGVDVQIPTAGELYDQLSAQVDKIPDVNFGLALPSIDTGPLSKITDRLKGLDLANLLDPGNKLDGLPADLAAIPPLVDPARLRELAALAAGAGKDAKTKKSKNPFSSGGGFAGRLAGLQLGQNAAADRTATATEATAKNTEKIIDKIGTGGRKYSA